MPWAEPLPAALGSIRSSVEIHERLAREHAANPQYQRDLFVSYLNLGIVLGGATITRELLSRAPPNIVNFRWQNAARSMELAEALKRAGKTREAISEARIANDTLIGLGASEPARREFQRLLLASHCMLSSHQDSAMDLLNSVRIWRA
jgi:hypothetical protein